jgi:hypothetical protein
MPITIQAITEAMKGFMTERPIRATIQLDIKRKAYILNL